MAAVEAGRQYVPPSKAVLNVLSDPGKSKHPSSSFLDQRSQSDTDMAVTVRHFVCAASMFKRHMTSKNARIVSQPSYYKTRVNCRERVKSSEYPMSRT